MARVHAPLASPLSSAADRIKPLDRSLTQEYYWPSSQNARLLDQLLDGTHGILLQALGFLLLGLQVDDECFFHLAGPPVTNGK